MMTYVKIGKHSGATIASAMKGTFLGIMTEDGKRLIKLNSVVKNIDPNKVYDVSIGDGTANIKVVTNAWACSKQTYDTIMHDGNEIINRMFGDLMK